MSRHLKCVGGLHDNECWYVRPGDRYIRLVRCQPLAAMADPRCLHTFYTVRKIRIGPDPVFDVLEFLAPERMSDAEAVKIQFAKC